MNMCKAMCGDTCNRYGKKLAVGAMPKVITVPEAYCQDFSPVDSWYPYILPRAGHGGGSMCTV